MQELIGLCIGLGVGFTLGFNYGVRKIADKAADAAADLMSALRERFGTPVIHTVVVEESGDNYRTEEVEFIELPEDIEDLAVDLYNLR